MCCTVKFCSADDVADWLGIRPAGLFNFSSAVRPVPLVQHIQGYAGKHYCPRMALMNKPTYQGTEERVSRNHFSNKKCLWKNFWKNVSTARNFSKNEIIENFIRAIYLGKYRFKKVRWIIIENLNLFSLNRIGVIKFKTLRWTFHVSLAKRRN